MAQANPPAKREWRVQVCEQLEDGRLLPDGPAMSSAMLELGAILTRIGGMAAVSVERIPLDNGDYLTTHLRIAYQTFAPVPPSEPAEEAAAPPAPAPSPTPPAADPSAEIAAAAAKASPPPPAPEPSPAEAAEPVEAGSAAAQHMTREERVGAGL